MGNKNHPKDTKPGYRVQPGATNGPYPWGNGPKPKGWIARLLSGRKDKQGK